MRCLVYVQYIDGELRSSYSFGWGSVKEHSFPSSCVELGHPLLDELCTVRSWRGRQAGVDPSGKTEEIGFP